MWQQWDIFFEWYIEKHKKQSIAVVKKHLLPVLEQIMIYIKRQPCVLIHRDYHSRNLMITAENTPGILDFQDAAWGPITYDVVSLMQDYYVHWPRMQVEIWATQFYEDLKHTGLIAPTVLATEFIQWMDWMGLQRHIKNLGVFARLHYRDGKSGYLKDIPMILRYIEEACLRYPELQDLKGCLPLYL
jgi:hypothetical protein